MSYKDDLHEKDGAWIADAQIAAGVDDLDNTHPLNCTEDGTLEVDLSGQSGPIDVIVDNIVPVSQSGAPWAENITEIGGAPLSEGQKTSAASIPVVIALDQSPIPVTVVPGGSGFFTYVTGTLSNIGSVVCVGVCTGIRVFAVGVDSSFTINTGQTISLRSNQIFQIIPQEVLTNPVIDWVSGEIDVWLEVRGVGPLPPGPADLGLLLGIAHLQ